MCVFVLPFVSHFQGCVWLVGVFLDQSQMRSWEKADFEEVETCQF